MYCSREYQLTSRFNQQYEKSTLNFIICTARALARKTIINIFEYVRCVHPTSQPIPSLKSFCNQTFHRTLGLKTLLNGFMHTFSFLINISCPIYCKLVLNNWHFLGDIFSPFFNKAFNMSSNLFV